MKSEFCRFFRDTKVENLGGKAVGKNFSYSFLSSSHFSILAHLLAVAGKKSIQVENIHILRLMLNS